MAILLWRRITLAILLEGQFIHLTQISLCPNIQLLSTQQHAFSRFWVTSWFYSVYNIVAYWVNFRYKCYHEKELQLQYGYVFWPKYMYFWIIYNFAFDLETFISKSWKYIYCSTRNLYIWAKILSHIVVG